MRSHRRRFWQFCAWMRIEPALQKKAKKNWLRLLPGILISAVSLVIVFYFIDLDRFIQAVRLADYRYVALLFGITLLWLVVRTIVWRTLLREQAAFPQVFLSLNEGYLLNNILPFRLGEAGRAFLLGKKTGLEFLQVFSTKGAEAGAICSALIGVLIIVTSNTNVSWNAEPILRHARA